MVDFIYYYKNAFFANEEDEWDVASKNEEENHPENKRFPVASFEAYVDEDVLLNFWSKEEHSK